MAEAIVVVTVLAVFLVLLMAVIALIKPFKIGAIGIFNTRKAALITISSSLAIGFAIVLIAALVGSNALSPDPKALAAKSAASASKAAQKSEYLKTQRTADARAFIEQISATVALCDSFDEKMATVTQTGDSLEIYQVAKEGEAACDQAYRDIKDIPAPKSLSKKNAKSMQEHMIDLAGVYLAKGYKFGLFGKVANGDNRPSTLTELQQASEGQSNRLIGAMGQIYMAFSDDGVDISSLAPAYPSLSDQQSQTIN